MAQSGKNGKPRWETVKTWLMESAGDHKYALQIQKARNGNPCLRLVEGVPQDDGSHRKFSVTIWSEDFARLFALLDETKQYIAEHNIKTPDGHEKRAQAKRHGKRRVSDGAGPT